MPSEVPTVRTLAIFGATGRTGSETLKSLLSHKSKSSSNSRPQHIKIYVRSRSKLLSIFPEFKAPRNDLEIFEGQITDIDRVRSCLEGADTIICALGENDNKPGVRVLQDLSKTIVTALKHLKATATAATPQKPPGLLLLSSSTWNERFVAQQPAPVHWLVKNAFYYPYADLLAAQATLRNADEEEGLLELTLVQPPALVEEEASGYQISAETVGLVVSYADLGAAFAELATEEAYKDVRAVGVTSGLAKEGFSRYGTEILYRVVRGLLASYMPGFWTINGVFNRVLG